MSGIAFQKLQGDKTTAGKQLNELIAINEALDELIELKKNERPEIYKLARMYYPDLELTPVMFTRNWEMARMKDNIAYPLDGQYFGVWQINVMLPDNAGGAQRRNYGHVRLYDGEEQKLNLACGHIGNRSRELSNHVRDYTGIADTIAITGGVGSPQHAKVNIDFYGFRVGDYIGGAEIPDEGESEFESFIDATEIVPFTGTYTQAVTQDGDFLDSDRPILHRSQWVTELGGVYKVSIKNDLEKDINLEIGNEIISLADGETFERTFLDSFEIYLKEYTPPIEWGYFYTKEETLGAYAFGSSLRDEKGIIVSEHTISSGFTRYSVNNQGYKFFFKRDYIHDNVEVYLNDILHEVIIDLDQHVYPVALNDRLVFIEKEIR